MGRKRWASGKTSDVVALRHRPGLGAELLEAGRDDLALERRTESRAKRRRAHDKPTADADADVDAPADVDAKTVTRIRETAMKQREEEELAANEAQTRLVRGWVEGGAAESDAEEDDDEDEDEERGEDANEYEDLEEAITDADEAAMSLFLTGAGPRRTLADIILEKLEEHERKRDQPEEEEPAGEKDTQMTEIFEELAEVMKLYKSGKVPKAFKMIPSLPIWEEVLYMTKPYEWSNNSFFVATRLFASNLDAKAAQRFYSDILLPRCRDDIANNRALNCHLYRSLKKACFKPAAFFKGIIFPLCEDGCTLREATIFGSVLAKMSIPMLHSAAALNKLAQLPFSGPTAVFMRVLLDKKYALPYRVVDALFEHFMGVADETVRMPVLWHQCVLTYAQRYKTEMLKSQKEKMKTLLRAQFHEQITPEIRLELFSARSRGDKVDPDANTIAMEISAAS